MNSLKLDEEAAKKEVARFDSSRREFTKRYFKAELEDPLHYDFVINTDHISFESAALIIVGIAPLKEQTT
jgi:cytidylate kinase